MADPAVAVAFIGGSFGLAGIVVGGFFSWLTNRRTVAPDATPVPAARSDLEAALKALVRDLDAAEKRADRAELRAIRCEAREAARDE